MSVAVLDEFADQGVEGLGQRDGFAAEPQPDLVFACVDVLEGEPADRGGGLGVEQHEQPGDAVLGFDAVIAQQPSGVDPAGFGVDDAPRAVPLGGGEGQACELVSSGPADEVSCVDAGGGVRAGQPLIEIALPSAGQVEPAGGEPVEQGDRSPDVALDGDALPMGLAPGGGGGCWA